MIVGNKIDNGHYTFKYLPLSHGNNITFTLPIIKPNHGAILRRTFYAAVGQWNFAADIWVNNKYQDVWFIAKGATWWQHSLLQEDFLISSQLTQNVESLTFHITPKTQWFDIEYQLLFIVR